MQEKFDCDMRIGSNSIDKTFICIVVRFISGKKTFWNLSKMYTLCHMADVLYSLICLISHDLVGELGARAGGTGSPNYPIRFLS